MKIGTSQAADDLKKMEIGDPDVAEQGIKMIDGILYIPPEQFKIAGGLVDNIRPHDDAHNMANSPTISLLMSVGSTGFGLDLSPYMAREMVKQITNWADLVEAKAAQDAAAAFARAGVGQGKA
jgi:hypothetical protein